MKVTRPPIVVVMGHIDHGKSTLLDHIRKTNVVATEVGGITQATSAYQIDLPAQAGLPDRPVGKITFLDTPGHEAFAGMRERGARIADIAILVVSAEEGVKVQTLEALDDIITAKLPYIVAINKIDRPNANPELVKQQLAEKNILLEGYGGTVPVAEISAKTGAGVSDLLELLLLLSELQDLTADNVAPASGFVLEAHLDRRAGITATLVIKDGTLRQGDFIVIATEVSKVKQLNNFQGKPRAELPPAAPAQVIGLVALPPVGAAFHAFPDKKSAERLSADEASAPAGQASAAKAALARTLLRKNQGESLIDGSVVEIPIVLKADVLGGLEALKHEVDKLNNDQVKLKIIGESVGQISDNDVKLAGAIPKSLVLGFNIAADKGARDLAEKLNVEIATFDIIYKLSEWLEEKIKTRLPKREEVKTLGAARLLKLFGGEKDRQVVGGVVTSGRMVVGKPVRILRRDNEIARGQVLELQEQKLPTKAVEADHQFGALVEAKLPLAAGDTLEVFEIVER